MTTDSPKHPCTAQIIPHIPPSPALLSGAYLGMPARYWTTWLRSCSDQRLPSAGTETTRAGRPVRSRDPGRVAGRLSNAPSRSVAYIVCAWAAVGRHRGWEGGQVTQGRRECWRDRWMSWKMTKLERWRDELRVMDVHQRRARDDDLNCRCSHLPRRAQVVRSKSADHHIAQMTGSPHSDQPLPVQAVNKHTN